TIILVRFWILICPGNICSRIMTAQGYFRDIAGCIKAFPPTILGMSNSALIVELRTKALEKLQESNSIFDQAFALLHDAGISEAEQMQALARAKRAEAAWLMAEADRLENESTAPPANTARAFS